MEEESERMVAIIRHKMDLIEDLLSRIQYYVSEIEESLGDHADFKRDSKEIY
jgi:hypothetical protein